MNQTGSFTRKVIYIAIIGGLLIPLSLISRPATRDQSNAIADAGGVLSQLRDKNDLSPAKLSEIDPGSETMKLASLGLRGLAVNLLWMKAIDAKEKKEWDLFSSTLNSLVKIQPSFIRVWEYQAHNLSYNVAVEFDDYEQRYHWIKKGIYFLTEGIPYNRRDHRIVDNLGMFSGNKFGTADERIQYRALFRNDDVFHDDMSKFVDIDKINTPYGPDHWLLAYQWYDRSLGMVEKGVDGDRVQKHRQDMLYYQYKPSQLRNMGLSMHAEFRSDEFAQANWTRAHNEWLDYGNRPIGVPGDPSRKSVTLEGMADSVQELQNLRQQLDDLAPGARTQLLASRMAVLQPDEIDLLSRPIDSLNDEELEELRSLEQSLYARENIDFKVFQSVAVDKASEAELIYAKIREVQDSLRIGDNFRSTINYDHWRDHTLVESTDRGIAARQAEFDASELRWRSLLDEHAVRNPITGDETVFPGAMQNYEKAFNIWSEVFREFPRLREGPLMDELVDVIKQYQVVREAAGRDPWPGDFVLQDVIDYRALNSRFPDELPTSEDVAQAEQARSRMRSLRIPTRPDIRFQLKSDADQ